MLTATCVSKLEHGFRESFCGLYTGTQQGGPVIRTATTERRSIATGGVRPNRILVVQLGVNVNEAKVFKAHAAPLGLCDNLINAVKLLANQQKDGDSTIQSIVTGLHERSRRGIMDGL